MGTDKLTFFSNLVEKNSLIVKKFLSVAKMAWTVYETENCIPEVIGSNPVQALISPLRCVYNYDDQLMLP